MSVRTRQQTITFRSPFLLGGIARAQPAGTYTVEIEEERIPDLSFAAYRRTATVIYLSSRQGGAGSYEAAVIDPVDLEAALQRDVLSVDSAVEPPLGEAAVEEVSQPSHQGSRVTFAEFVERFRAAGIRLRRVLAR